MNDILRIARLKIALQRAFLGRAILIFTIYNLSHGLSRWLDTEKKQFSRAEQRRLFFKISKGINYKPTSGPVGFIFLRLGLR